MVSALRHLNVKYFSKIGNSLYFQLPLKVGDRKWSGWLTRIVLIMKTVDTYANLNWESYAAMLALMTWVHFHYQILSIDTWTNWKKQRSSQFTNWYCGIKDSFNGSTHRGVRFLSLFPLAYLEYLVLFYIHSYALLEDSQFILIDISHGNFLISRLCT